MVIYKHFRCWNLAKLQVKPHNIILWPYNIFSVWYIVKLERSDDGNACVFHWYNMVANNFVEITIKDTPRTILKVHADERFGKEISTLSSIPSHYPQRRRQCSEPCNSPLTSIPLEGTYWSWHWITAVGGSWTLKTPHTMDHPPKSV